MRGSDELSRAIRSAGEIVVRSYGRVRGLRAVRAVVVPPGIRGLTTTGLEEDVAFPSLTTDKIKTYEL